MLLPGFAELECQLLATSEVLTLLAGPSVDQKSGEPSQKLHVSKGFDSDLFTAPFCVQTHQKLNSLQTNLCTPKCDHAVLMHLYNAWLQPVKKRKADHAMVMHLCSA